MASQSQALRLVVKQGNGVYPVLPVHKPSTNLDEGTVTRASGVLFTEAGLLVPETKTSPRKGQTSSTHVTRKETALPPP